MPVLYVARKKMFKVAGILKSLYYMVPRAFQKKAVTEKDLANDLAELSSLSPGDVLSVLRLFPDKLAHHLKNGRTITIDGLGMFYLAISSEGAETPEECTPKTLRSFRVCFRPDDEMRKKMQDCRFERMPDTPTENNK